MRQLEYKSYSTTEHNIITDVDVKGGKVVGYFSVFNVLDSDGDVVLKGAFKKSLQENYSRIKHLYQHNPVLILSGTKKGALKVYEDDYGLRFESEITPTSYGKDMLLLYESGAIDEQSTGTITIKDEKKGGVRYIKESMIFEGSTVTWGSNKYSLGDKKSLFDAEHINNRILKFEKLLKDGRFENEDVFEAIDYHIKQLHTALATQDTSTTQPLKEVSTEPDYKDLKLALSLFNLKTNTY
jgi:HK97 family phage prohead protease